MKMKHGLTMALGITVLALGGMAVREGVASAAPSQAALVPPAPDGSQIPSGEYDADKAHSYLTFSYLHQGYSYPILSFDNFGVRLTLDAKAPEKSKIFANINASSIHSGTQLFDGELKGARWFDVEKYPEIRFNSVSIQPSSDPKIWKLAGNLTIKGITKPVVLDVRVNRTGNGWWTNKPMVGVSATGVIKRSEWGMGDYVPQISDDVKVALEMEFIKLDQ